MRAILFPVLASAVLALTALGCGEETTINGPGEDVDAPEFAEGEGQVADEALAYPEGPYGIEIDSIVENFQFRGYPAPYADQSEDQTIQLADFYNPTGSDVYPEGSLFGAGNPKPTVLLIAVSAVWCGPCQYENDVVLPVEYAKYKPQGAEFLLNLANYESSGDPAKFSHLKAWTTKYDTQWPAVIDPTLKLTSLFEANAFPQNILIDTTTMQVLEVIAGVAEEGSPFFDILEAHLK